MRRVDVLARLCESPAHKRDLVETMDHSRSTLDRAVRELEGLGLVERREDGIAATVAGRLAVERAAALRDGLSDFLAAREVLDPLPVDAPVSPDAVAGSEATLATEPTPYRPVERYHDELADADRYRAVLPYLDDPRHVRILYERVVTEGRPAKLVVAPELFETLREEFPQRLAAMADRDGFRLLVGEDLPQFALGIVNREDGSSTVAVLVFAGNGVVHGVLTNDDPGALGWAEDRFERAREAATDRTHALTADTDGGTAPPVEAATGVDPAGRSLPVSLERAGFVRLDAGYFREEPVVDPATAWRAGLSLPEVHAGYAVERTASGEEHDPTGLGDDGGPDGRAMADALVERLASGTDCAVVGRSGSGKSTVCKRVACRWYDADRGTVLYRESGRGGPVDADAVGDLVGEIDDAAGHTLVVVEDAVRPGTAPVFEAVRRRLDRESASFLFDARESEWTDPPEDHPVPPDVEVVPMPRLTRDDAERIAKRLRRTGGGDVELPLDRLLSEVRSAAAGGPDELVLLLHRVATFVDPLAEGPTSLESAVADTYDRLREGESSAGDAGPADAGETDGSAGTPGRDEVALDVCVLANLLNAAGLGVEPGVLYAVTDPDGFGAVDAALDRLEGRVLFPREDGAGGSYRTVHEAWSTAFLAHLIEAEGEAAAADRVGDCLTAALSLADDAERRGRIAGHCDEPWGPSAVANAPGEWADRTAEAAYRLIRERPKLAPLFGDGEADTVTLPEACSDAVASRRPIRLGRAFVDGGYYDRAERAFGRLPTDDPERATERLLGLSRVERERGNYDEAGAHLERLLSILDEAGTDGKDLALARSRAALRRGQVASDRGDYGTAHGHLRTALEAFEAAGDRRRTAQALSAMGLNALRQGESDRASQHHDRALGIYRDLGDRRGAARSLNSLGIVARRRGSFDEAREWFERSVALSRELGDRAGESNTLNNLGILAAIRGEYERGRDYLERSLELVRDLGDRQGEADTLDNLALILERLGEYDRARKYHERTLEIKRELGDRRGEAATLNNLGAVLQRRGNYERAVDRRRQSREIAREIGNRRVEAHALGNLGTLARLRGEYEEAREYFEHSIEIKEEVGDRQGKANSHTGLGEVALECGDYDRARDRFATAAEVLGEDEDPFRVAERTLARGRLALASDDPGTAGQRAARARESFASMGAVHMAARARRLLGRVADREGKTGVAREHWRTALETFDSVGASQDALATLSHLVATCEAAGDERAARRWRDRAREVAPDAPAPARERCRRRVGEIPVGDPPD